LSTIQFGNVEPVVLLEIGLLNLVTQQRFFLVTIFNKITVNMTSCSDLKEGTDEEDEKSEKSPGETEKTLAALVVIPIYLKWGQIFSLLGETRQHMVAACNNQKSML